MIAGLCTINKGDKRYKVVVTEKIYNYRTNNRFKYCRNGMIITNARNKRPESNY